MPVLKEIGYEGDFSFEVGRMGQHVPRYLSDSLWAHLLKVGEYLISLAG
ncbi:MAG TPA: aminoglycoside 6-adenylyltransferase [Candidatus Eisenbergiella intestinipullorum]|nr:aminoglycoside 6-adenylyltransferase [Candidatus Eisenbergiella intestinipullorum]